MTMTEKTTPEFVAVDSLRPGTQNLNLVVKVRSDFPLRCHVKAVPPKSRSNNARTRRPYNRPVSHARVRDKCVGTCRVFLHPSHLGIIDEPTGAITQLLLGSFF